jgi:hypothetical protein
VVGEQVDHRGHRGHDEQDVRHQEQTAPRLRRVKDKPHGDDLDEHQDRRAPLVWQRDRQHVCGHDHQQDQPVAIGRAEGAEQTPNGAGLALAVLSLLATVGHLVNPGGDLTRRHMGTASPGRGESGVAAWRGRPRQVSTIAVTGLSSRPSFRWSRAIAEPVERTRPRSDQSSASWQLRGSSGANPATATASSAVNAAWRRG